VWHSISSQRGIVCAVRRPSSPSFCTSQSFHFHGRGEDGLLTPKNEGEDGLPTRLQNQDEDDNSGMSGNKNAYLIVIAEQASSVSN
jgi:hypothetical protein